jgi:hypothetical protein
MTITNTPILSKQDTIIYLSRALQLLEAPCVQHMSTGHVANKAHSWIQGQLAVDAKGYQVPPESDLAVAYCEIGAIKAVTHYDQQPEAAYKYVTAILHAANPAAIVAVRGAHNTGGVPTINDHPYTTFERVRKMFTRAIHWSEKHL